MLTIHLNGREEKEIWDPKKEQFITLREIKPIDLKLEHSLISISKWEAKWHTPFISKTSHTEEQTIDYIKCMNLNPDIKDDVYDLLTAEDIKVISDYITDPMTATTISDAPGSKKSNETVTSELIYYWMTALQIPFACEKWHLNRLLQLIAVCNAKNTPPKKMSKKEIMERNKSLNEARKAKYHTKG